MDVIRQSRWAATRKTMKNRSFVVTGLLVLLAACNSNVPSYAPTIVPTTTITSISHPTVTSTATTTPMIEIEGALFFDLNGSGLLDQATFAYDPSRLTDEIQPLQPDLLASIKSQHYQNSVKYGE